MNKSSEEKFRQILKICKSLPKMKYYPTDLIFSAITLFCELATNSSDLLLWEQKYATEVEKASLAVYEYATSVDNWRVDCSLGFGVKDHCTILNFFLNLYSHKFDYFTGNFHNPNMIIDLIKDWQGIDLGSMFNSSQVVR